MCTLQWCSLNYVHKGGAIVFKWSDGGTSIVVERNIYGSGVVGGCGMLYHGWYGMVPWMGRSDLLETMQRPARTSAASHHRHLGQQSPYFSP